MEINHKNLGGGAIPIECFNWIRKNLKDGSVILELGSGTGTVELCKFYDVITVEHSEEWVGTAKNATYIYAPLIDGWYDREILEKELPKKYDLLIVDGPIREDRLHFFLNTDLFSKNIPIIFDDTQRENLKDLVIKLSKDWNKTLTEFNCVDKNLPPKKQKKFSVLI